MYTYCYFILIPVMKPTHLHLIDPSQYYRAVSDITIDKSHIFQAEAESVGLICFLCSFLSHVVFHHGLIVFQHAVQLRCLLRHCVCASALNLKDTLKMIKSHIAFLW